MDEGGLPIRPLCIYRFDEGEFLSIFRLLNVSKILGCLSQNSSNMVHVALAGGSGGSYAQPVNPDSY